MPDVEYQKGVSPSLKRVLKGKGRLDFTNFMANDKIKVSGIVEDILPGEKFNITLPNGTNIIGYLSGKIRMNKIRIIPGDTVEVELSIYDLTKGRIVYRH